MSHNQGSLREEMHLLKASCTTGIDVLMVSTGIYVGNSLNMKKFARHLMSVLPSCYRNVCGCWKDK